MFEKNGIVVLNKPTGMSSFYAVKKVQRLLGAKKAGHMGTLDPLGTGVLLIGINKGTKLFDEYLNKTKEYIATFEFGVQTDTLDSEGTIVKEDDKIISETQIKSILKEFIGTFAQMPPEYSAKKVNGQKACDLARQGKNVKLKPKNIEIYDISLIDKIKENCFVFKIICSAGTYIRSIARDIAKRFNTCATMVSIIRTKCGNFCIEQSCTIEDIANSKIAFYEL